MKGDSKGRQQSSPRASSCSNAFCTLNLNLGSDASLQPQDVSRSQWESDGWPPSIGDIMQRGIECRAFPGGAVALGTCSAPVFQAAYGHYTYDVGIPIECSESLWDLASLTKVLATVPAIMILYERDLLGLDDLACKYIPQLGNGKQGITVRMLLTHTAGLKEWHPFFALGLNTKAKVLQFIMEDKLWYPLGLSARYSDLSMILLGLIVESITGCSLSSFVTRHVYTPLGMESTGFRRLGSTPFSDKAVPTEYDALHRQCLLWGEVHDPTAWILGGEAGHAGLFSTLPDVAKFAQMMLAGGINENSGVRIFQASTVRLFTSPPLPTPHNPRPFALGWDLGCRRGTTGYTSAGQYLGPRTFGHTGFTGTSFWMDPDQNMFIVLLTNSVHPTACSESSELIRAVRPLVADAAVYAMGHLASPRESFHWHLGVPVENMPWQPRSIQAVLQKIVKRASKDGSIEMLDMPFLDMHACQGPWLLPFLDPVLLEPSIKPEASADDPSTQADEVEESTRNADTGAGGSEEYHDVASSISQKPCLASVHQSYALLKQMQSTKAQQVGDNASKSIIGCLCCQDTTARKHLLGSATHPEWREDTHRKQLSIPRNLKRFCTVVSVLGIVGLFMIKK